MDPRSTIDKGNGETSPAPDTTQPARPGTGSSPESPGAVRFPAEDGGKSLADMAQRDLTATLQLLAERAQYITGATGAAIALRDHEEMVCRASAGSSAPEVGAQLQINSGLSGESVRTRQTLRCDDAFTDRRVNRESCEALGIRSVVVMPLIRGNEVIGVFELFSDQANVFAARDITALERMGAMVHTALEHSAAALGIAPITGEAARPLRAFEPAAPGNGRAYETFALDPGMQEAREELILSDLASRSTPELETESPSDSPAVLPVEASASPEPVRRSGIAFHMRMPAATRSAAAADAPPVPPAQEVPEPSLPALEPELPPASADPALGQELDDMEILESLPDVERSGVPAVRTAAAEEILVTETEPPSEAPRVPTSLAASYAAADTAAPALDEPETPPAPVVASRGAIANLRKCEACGFPVSEGRQLCLDCEKKKVRATGMPAKTALSDKSAAVETPMQAPPRPASPAPVEDAPLFMSGEPQETSWLANHKYMVIAIVVAAVGIVAVLLLR